MIPILSVFDLILHCVLVGYTFHMCTRVHNRTVVAVLFFGNESIDSWQSS